MGEAPLFIRFCVPRVDVESLEQGGGCMCVLSRGGAGGRGTHGESEQDGRGGRVRVRGEVCVSASFCVVNHTCLARVNGRSLRAIPPSERGVALGCRDVG